MNWQSIPENLWEEDSENGGLENLSQTDCATRRQLMVCAQLHDKFQGMIVTCHRNRNLGGVMIKGRLMATALTPRHWLSQAVRSQSPGHFSECRSRVLQQRRSGRAKALVISMSKLMERGILRTISIIHQRSIHYTACSAQTRAKLRQLILAERYSLHGSPSTVHPLRIC
jgi:hypothetical protein